MQESNWSGIQFGWKLICRSLDAFSALTETDLVLKKKIFRD